ncbi:hypothetical protein [Ammoniphilus resinae]|uniref:Uncharacterized protein n=1 Tax=Ammoniphilus resinae TaxID=861532 RepID=A0ABS4GWT0_9BACL|nr:hypothetical protein [Ammoniphilus resinae]MBP1934719.1 hypothetical protein [Ammoniphilus resinae]
MPQLEFENEKEIIIEKYKEVSANRRHYSALRFALLPFYFAIQGAIAKEAFGKEDSLPFYLCSISGIITTYVFLTIERRISDYYSHLEDVGAKLEEQLNLGEKMFVNWPKSKFLSNTKQSINFSYFLCATFWVIFFIIKIVKELSA